MPATDGYIIGADPGLSGALALLDHDGKLIDVRRDFKELPDIARAFMELMDCAPVRRLVIENVHAMPGQGVSSMFSFGKAAGVLLGVATTYGFGTTRKLLNPVPHKWIGDWRKWLEGMAIKGIKKGEQFDSVAVALKINACGGNDHFLKRKKDHNTADAILLALWGLKQ